MSAQPDLLGWQLEHVRRSADGEMVRTRGRCVGAWPNGGALVIALLREDDEGMPVVLVEHWRETELRVVGGRKVPTA
jgi:hypothetical protein